MGNQIIGVDDLRSIWRVFIKNWYIILLFLLVGYVLSYVYLYKKPNVYAAQSQILLKSDGTYDYQDQIYKGLGYYDYYQDNINQIRVLTSNDIIQKTLNKMDLGVSYFIIGRIKTTEVYQGMPFKVEAQILNNSFYEKPIRLRILDTERLEISFEKDGTEIKHNLFFNKEFQSGDIFLQVTKNSNLNAATISALKEIDYMFRVNNPQNLLYKFKGSLNVENIESTSVLQLTLTDEIPERAIAFLDTLCQVYMANTMESQLLVNENTQVNIDKQLKEVTSILEQIESDLEQYKSNKTILNLTRQEDDYFDQMLVYDNKKRDLVLQLNSLESLEKYVLNSQNEALLPPSLYVHNDDNYLQSSLNELYSAQMSRNGLMFNATANSAAVKQLDGKIDLLRKNLLGYIQSSQKGVKERIKDVDKQLADFLGIIKGIPKSQRDLLNIGRKLQVNEKMYLYLLEKRANTIIARAGILPQTSIIESPHHGGLVYPNRTKITNLFLVVSLSLSLIFIFIRTTFFSKIENMIDLKKETSLPVLGELLRVEDDDSYVIVNQDPKSLITESFRNIRTNIQFFSSGKGSKAILVTSFSPGEGKTFCSVNLATIFANANKKVLLVELDLHKPKIQHAFNKTSTIGVTTVLIEKSKVGESIIPSGIENLDLLLAGPTPPNASELILREQLNDIFAYGKEHYDFVIVDTGPVSLISDALVLVKHTDITLFVLNAATANRAIINETEEIVKDHSINNFGFILNNVKKTRSRYYYHYSYGFGYGYGYGYGAKQRGYGYGVIGNKKSEKTKKETV